MYTLIRKYITGFASNARGELVMFGLNSLNIGGRAVIRDDQQEVLWVKILMFDSLKMRNNHK